jgi:O-antigen/teichoic acid export membrane protein
MVVRKSAGEVAVSGEAAQARARPSFVSATLQTYGTNLLVAALSLLNVLIVSRALGPSGRGQVVFLTAIAWFTSNLSTFGVQEANANLAGAEPRLRRSLATNSLLLALAFGVLTAAVLGGLIWVFPAIAGDSDQQLRWLVFASLPFLILWVYLRFLVQADYGFTVTNIGWLLTPVANVTVNGLLAAFGVLTVGAAVCAWLAGQLLGTALLVWYVARRLAGFGRPDLQLARRVMAFGLRSHVGRIMLLGNYRLDQWILGAVSGSRELGLYSVAVAWAESLWYFPTAVAAVQRPNVVRASRAEAARHTAAAFRVAALVTLVLMVAIVIAAPFLCTTIFGEEFRGSIDDLRLLVAGSVGVVALKQLGSALTGQGAPTLASAAIALGFVCTVVLDIVLIPPFGGLGAAAASTIAYTVGGLAAALILSRAMKLPLRELVPRWEDVVLLHRTAKRLRPRRPTLQRLPR